MNWPTSGGRRSGVAAVSRANAGIASAGKWRSASVTDGATKVAEQPQRFHRREAAR